MEDQALHAFTPGMSPAIQSPAAADRRSSSPSIAHQDRRELVRLITAADVEGALQLITSLVRNGIGEEVLLTDLMAGAARTLGQGWESDRLDFAEVTIGMCVLHRLLREHDWGAPLQPYAADAPRILLTTFAGEQHGFGAMMVDVFFRRAAWVSRAMPCEPVDRVHRELSAHAYDIIGISGASYRPRHEAAAQIKALRGASKNPAARVIIGGPVFGGGCEELLSVGADGYASDAKGAVALANQLHRRAKVCTETD